MRHYRPLLTALTAVLVMLAGTATAQAGSSAEAIREAINDPARRAEDKKRDEDRQPAAVLAYLGLEPGMTVLDLMASGGWYTEVLSFAVGEDGKVYAQNSPAFLEFRDGAYEKAISERLEGDRLPNVERINADFTDMGLENEVDLAITALNFHDIYNRSPEAGVAMLKQVKKALKPGGVVGLIDHKGAEGNDNSQLHRMKKQDAIDAAKAAGFEVAESDLLSNPDDDLSAMVFDPEIRGKTDRFLLKLTKPES